MKVYEILSKRSCSIWTHKQNKTKNGPREEQTKRKNWEKPRVDSNCKQKSFEKISKGMFECVVEIDLLCYSE